MAATKSWESEKSEGAGEKGDKLGLGDILQPCLHLGVRTLSGEPERFSQSLFHLLSESPPFCQHPRGDVG